MKELYDFVKENINPDFHFSDIMRGEPTDKSYSPPTVNELEGVIDRIIEVQSSYKFGKKPELRIFSALKTLHLRVALETMRKRKRLMPCYAGKNNAVVYPNGDVAFCELLESIGNLRKVDYDFKKLWFCEKAEKLRKLVKKCYCTHSCFQTTNILKNPRFYPSILKFIIS
jgi:MoaA/NifB/PqqE/SkfB family radical SAM enzyme